MGEGGGIFVADGSLRLIGSSIISNTGNGIDEEDLERIFDLRRPGWPGITDVSTIKIETTGF